MRGRKKQKEEEEEARRKEDARRKKQKEEEARKKQKEEKARKEEAKDFAHIQSFKDRYLAPNLQAREKELMKKLLKPEFFNVTTKKFEDREEFEIVVEKTKKKFFENELKTLLKNKKLDITFSHFGKENENNKNKASFLKREKATEMNGEWGNCLKEMREMVKKMKEMVRKPLWLFLMLENFEFNYMIEGELLSRRAAEESAAREEEWREVRERDCRYLLGRLAERVARRAQMGAAVLRHRPLKWTSPPSLKMDRPLIWPPSSFIFMDSERWRKT